MSNPLPDTIAWVDVESSNVARVGWDDGDMMYIEYIHGNVYRYHPMSRQKAVACAHAKSVGRFVNKEIRGHAAPEKLVGNNWVPSGT